MMGMGKNLVGYVRIVEVIQGGLQREVFQIVFVKVQSGFKYIGGNDLGC